MSAIGPGDWVQCVRESRADDVVLRLGGVYCVESVTPDDGVCQSCGDEGAGLILVGVPQPELTSWCPCAFKPLGGQHDAEAVETRVCEPA